MTRSGRRNPEIRTESTDESTQTSRESQPQGPRAKEFNNTLNPTLSGKVILKAGLSMTANNYLSGLALKTQLSRYSSALQGKYNVENLTATLNQDVTIDINPPLNLSGVRLSGRVEIPTDSSAQIKTSELIENPDGTSRVIETVDSSRGTESNEQELTPEQLAQYKIEESQDRSRESRQDLAHSIMSDISEIFSSDQNFLQKLSAVITLILDRLMGGNNSQSNASSNSSLETSEQESQENQEQVSETIREEFNLDEYRQKSVLDLRRNPSPAEASDLSSYFTFQAEGEAARKRLIIRPESSTISVPSGFETKSLENYESELQSADEEAFTNNLNQPLAIESKATNPGFVSLVSVMQNFLKTPESNSSKRAEIANNIRSQFIQEGNPNSAIASRFLETFLTSG